jgi:hypothetical protein
MNKIKVGATVAFEANFTRQPLQGTVIHSGNGQVKIKTPDGEEHYRVASRVMPMPLRPRRPDIATRFKYMRKVVQMVANADVVSAIISGPGGLGKSHTVTDTLASLGMKKGVDYQLVKGFTSARGLYETLYNNNDVLTVFDDCDSALKDRNSASILKGALDSHAIREISWLVKSSTMDAAIPLKFDYDGRIIFVTNKLVQELDGPLRTRSLVVNLQMTRQEILDWLEHLLPDIKGFSMADKTEALAFIRSVAPAVGLLSIRTILMVLRIMKASPLDWQELSEHTLTQ